jgi:hypothetical protein
MSLFCYGRVLAHVVGETRYLMSYYHGKDIQAQLAAPSTARDVIDAWLQVSDRILWTLLKPLLNFKDPIETPVAF